MRLMRTIARTAACVLGLLVAGTASAATSAPIKGALYKGVLTGARASVSISFRVSADGSRVQAVKIASLPMYCAGSGPPGTPDIAFASARISASGHFRSAGEDTIATGPLKGSVVATVTVAGSFASGGREHGTVTTSYGGTAKACGGHSAYSTRG